MHDLHVQHVPGVFLLHNRPVAVGVVQSGVIVAEAFVNLDVADLKIVGEYPHEDSPDAVSEEYSQKQGPEHDEEGCCGAEHVALRLKYRCPDVVRRNWLVSATHVMDIVAEELLARKHPVAEYQEE